MYLWQGGDSSETNCSTTSIAGSKLVCAITPTKANGPKTQMQILRSEYLYYF